MVRFVLAVLALALCADRPARATTFTPLTFDDLVARADMIFVGEVTDIRTFPLITREGPIVKTRVIFRISDPIFGAGGAVEVLEFLGGEWGDVGMAVAGMPEFAIGDRRVVFAHRARSINPIVGFTQGLLRVTRDNAGVDRVFTSDGTPVGGPESIGPRGLGSPVTQAAAMRLSDFRERLTRALAAARRR